MLDHVHSLYAEGQVSFDLKYMQKRYAEFQVDPAIDRDEFSQWKKRTSFLESELEAILNVLTSAEASANREKRPEPDGPHAKEGEDRLMTFKAELTKLRDKTTQELTNVQQCREVVIDLYRKCAQEEKKKKDPEGDGEDK